MPPLRYRCLSYVAIDVTDLRRAEAFQLNTVGLELNSVVERNAPVSLLRSAASWCDVALYEGPEPALRRVAFEMESPEQIDLARHHLEGLGIAHADVSEADRRLFALSEGLRFVEPRTGLAIELHIRDRGVALPALASGAPLTRITRLGHVVVYVTDARGLVRFFLDELNFRASDFVGDATFLRCFPNPYHHSFAVVPGPENRLNHVNLLVEDIDDVGRALYRLKAQEVPIVFGPGRHPPSGSVFLYFTDPDGLTFELSTGMEEFPERDPRPPRDLPRVPESLDYWGSTRAEAYGQVGRFVATS
jgi:2,3-dihydroxy-p-cumate/2,3-dihydroxybenzoate 3,4-dioxygenase